MYFYTCHDADPIHFKVETGCISSIDYFWGMIDKIQIGKSEFIYSLIWYENVEQMFQYYVILCIHGNL